MQNEGIIRIVRSHEQAAAITTIIHVGCHHIETSVFQMEVQVSVDDGMIAHLNGSL